MKKITLTQLRKHLGQFVEHSGHTRQRYMIYNHNRPVAGLVSMVDLDALNEVDHASNIEYRNYQMAEKVVKMEALHQAMQRLIAEAEKG